MWYDLLKLIGEKNFSAAEKLLEKNPDLILTTNKIGETVLHFCAVENDLEAVQWLYQKGYKLDTKNKFGIPVIFEVAQLGYKDLLIWFYKNGANFNCKDADGNDITEFLRDYEKIEMIEFIVEKNLLN